MLNAKPLLASSKMLNANKPTVPAILPQRDRLILILPKMQGKLIKEISSVYSRHVFTSVTYYWLLAGRTGIETLLDWCQGRGCWMLPKENVVLSQYSPEKRGWERGLGAVRGFAGYRDMWISLSSRCTTIDFISEVLISLPTLTLLKNLLWFPRDKTSPYK